MTRPLVRATAAYVVGQSAHATFMYYLVPVALKSAGLDANAASLFTLIAISMGLAVVPAGLLADRVPRRRVLRGGLALLALAYAPLLVAPTMTLLVLGTVATGVGLALLVVSFNSYVADLLAATERSSAYGRVTALSILATATGPFAAALIFRATATTNAGIVANALVFGAATLLTAALTWGLPHVERIVSGPAKRSEMRAAAPIMVAYLLIGLGYGMTVPYFAIHFLGAVGLSGERWGYVLAAATLASALGSLAAGQLARRLDPRLVAVGGQMGLLAASLPFLAADATALVQTAALVARYLFSATTSPVMAAALMSRASQRARAEAHGYSMLAWNAGWATGAVVGATMLARLGSASFVVGASVALAGAAAGASLLRERA